MLAQVAALDLLGRREAQELEPAQDHREEPGEQAGGNAHGQDCHHGRAERLEAAAREEAGAFPEQAGAQEAQHTAHERDAAQAGGIVHIHVHIHVFNHENGEETGQEAQQAGERRRKAHAARKAAIMPVRKPLIVMVISGLR